MKKTILTLAAVLALSGSAFAASATQPVKQAPAAATCVDAKTHVKLDCSATGSIEKATSSTQGKGPKIGIDINPWIVPSF
ncbi:DUF680 domain-containing protein [Mesorhizobium shangrilense]|uniref:DUF680 domain-containing protein n=1 Tax=Mesorhizobium shangrilense TaxID=460060 RepID=A0ABV2DJW2_9HYPH